MRINDRGPGILSTHVTLTDVEEAISERFGVPVRMGSKTQVRRIGAADVSLKIELN